MRENNQQELNFQDIRIVHTTEQQKTKKLNQKMGRISKYNVLSPKKIYKWPIST